MSVVDTSVSTFVDTSVPSFVGTCPICAKTYTREIPYNRHVKYCRRAQAQRKGRPKSCVPCSTSKTKCSFAKPSCSRCDTKGLKCSYEQPEIRASVNAARGQSSATLGLDQQPDLAPSGDINWPGSGFETENHLLPVADVTFSPEEPTSFSNVVKDAAKWNNITPQLRMILSTTYSGPWPEDLELQSTQSSSSASDAVPYSKPLKTLVHLRYRNPAAVHAASLLSHIISAFPQMMLRRQTFPPFIHGYWHTPSLPEKIATCMSISQLFASRTPETRSFLWRMIDAEETRFRDELWSMSVRELQTTVQAITIYMIMAIVDQEANTPIRGPRMIQTFQMLSLRFLELLGGQTFATTEQIDPSFDWDSWVFAESRRRVKCLWFVFSHVVSAKVETPCYSIFDLDLLPTPSSKTLWEARSLDEWETEKAYFDISRPIVTFGELAEAKKNPTDPLNVQKLQSWEAGSDKMAVMLNIAMAFI